MAKELILEDGPLRREFITPGGDGSAVIRTQYKGTDAVLDQLQRERQVAPESFVEKGVTFYKAASIPMEVYEQLWAKLGRDPTARELLDLAQSRDYRKLQVMEKTV